MYRTSDDQLNLRDFFFKQSLEEEYKVLQLEGKLADGVSNCFVQKCTQWVAFGSSLSQSVQYRCTAWVNFHQPQYRFTERYQFPLAPYQLSFHPTLLTYIASKDLFQFFVPFCFHASLVFCTHTHTHFLLTTRYLTVTEGKFHLIPFHIIRHLLGSHCHVMTISEGREQTLFCSLL